MKQGAIKKLLSILEPPFRRKAYGLQGYLFLGVLFESVGLGMIIPLVNVITNPDAARNGALTAFIRKFTGDIATSQLVLVVLAAFVVFYIIKTVFLSFLVWKQSDFTQGLSNNVSNRLFAGYISQPYVFFLDKNSGVLMKNIVAEVSSFTAYVQALMYVQTEFSVLIGIVVTLLIIEPVGALIVFAFVGGISFLLIRISKKRVTTWGKSRQQFDALRSKSLLQGLTGVSELKLFQKEDFFLGQYREFNRGFYDSQRRVQFMSQVQRYYLECVLIVSIVVLCFAVMLQGRPLGQILPSLSLFLFASLRLLPSANRIISNLQTMRFTRPGVDLVYEEFCAFPAQQRQQLKYHIDKINDSVRLEQVSFSYPSAPQRSLMQVSLELKAGSVVGIIGQSGSGKTTLVNILSGLLQPTEGRIWVDDTDVTHSVHELQRHIGYVPQTIFLIDDTLKRNIAFGIADHSIDLQRLQQVIEAAQLEQVVAGMEHGIDTMIGERGVKLSGGQRQRIGIARALYHHPEILILDEGTSALDTETENYIMESVSHLKGKLTILLIAHRYSTLHICDIVYKMQNGKIVSRGKLEELV
ncbi:MAG: ABC transporter ATP-binding protein [Chitinophagaceae bacterium]|nr:ABC transporter ATP-binding protein [Chitinophagaceae bacterium]